MIRRTTAKKQVFGAGGYKASVIAWERLEEENVFKNHLLY